MHDGDKDPQNPDGVQWTEPEAPIPDDESSPLPPDDLPPWTAAEPDASPPEAEARPSPDAGWQALPDPAPVPVDWAPPEPAFDDAALELPEFSPPGPGAAGGAKSETHPADLGEPTFGAPSFVDAEPSFSPELSEPDFGEPDFAEQEFPDHPDSPPLAGGAAQTAAGGAPDLGLPPDLPSWDPAASPDEPDEDVQAGDDGDALERLIAAIDEEVQRAGQPDVHAALVVDKSAATDEQHHVVIFTLEGTDYAAPVANVLEISRPLSITSLPNLPEWVLGVSNLRGDIISIVDLRRLLGMESGDAISGRRLMVVRSLDKDLTTGLIVDRVRQIRFLPADQISAPTAPIEGLLAAYLLGVCVHEGRIVALLDIERLLLSPEMQQFESGGLQ